MENNEATPQAKSENNESITFKISAKDKQKLMQVSSDIGLNLSDYIRIKLFLDEPDLHAIIKENKELKVRAKENLVRQFVVRTVNPEDETITLLMTKKGKVALKELLEEIKPKMNMWPQEVMDNDMIIGSALSYFISERLSLYLSELDDFRIKYGITQFEQFYMLLFEPYYSTIFHPRRILEFDDE